MEMIADILLIAGAAGAAFYCIVLSRRLNRFNNLEQGMGGAIAVLSAQVDDMTKALNQAQGSAHGSAESLERLTDRAEDVAKRLELLVASMHDLPVASAPTPAPRPAPEPQPVPQPPVATQQPPASATPEPPAAMTPSPAPTAPAEPPDPAPSEFFRSRRGLNEAAE